jgi:hypothetical protein
MEPLLHANAVCAAADWRLEEMVSAAAFAIGLGSNHDN